MGHPHAVTESHALLATVAHLGAEPLAVYDASGYLLEGNRAAARLPDRLNAPALTWFDPEESVRERPLSTILSTLRRSGWQGLLRHTTERSEDWFLVHLTSLDDDPGRLRILLSAHDATALQSRLSALQDEHAFWKRAVIAGTDGVWETEGARAYLSPQARAMLGFEPHELPADPQSLLERLHPDDRAQWEEALKAPEAPRRLSCRLRCKDGSYKRVLLRSQTEQDLPQHRTRTLGLLTDLSRQEAPRERYRQIGELVDDLVTLHDADFVTLYATPSAQRIIDREADAVVGTNILDGVAPDERRRLLLLLRRLRRGQDVQVCWRLSLTDGEDRWLETRVRQLIDDAWKPARYLCTTRDISGRLSTEEKMLWQARHDTLTGLPNRRYFLERVNDEVTALPDDGALAVLFIDLDGFKKINDTLGHAAGDAMLTAVAQRLTESVRVGDVVGRMGGDEFTVLLSPLRRDEEPEEIVRRLIAAVAQPVPVGAENLFVSASVGISRFPEDGTDADTLVRHADLAMYQAKQSGNTFRRFEPAMTERAQRRLQQENVLRRALENGEFEMHFQPQVDLHTQEIVALEALLRWQSPGNEEPISPGRFIALAESTGLIEPLGSWILQTVCEHLSHWERSGVVCPLVAVNVSAQQFAKPWFLRKVEETLLRYHLRPQSLELELTESAFLGRGDTARQTIDKLKALGLRLSVDDFGTGYSALSYLRDLPLDAVKIDASFLRSLATVPQTRPILRAIIELAHALKLEVIAEGVENEEQRDLLVQLNCDRVQGFLVSRAVPADAVPALLERIGVSARLTY
jgi:diguanylate cyclase (GGDEF)-like protein/PAS domain S-box-containing protein